MTEDEIARLKGMNDDDMNDKNDKSIKQIGTVDPVNDFKKMVEDRKVDRVQPALQQMKVIIDRFIRSSVQGDIFDKALECLISLRQSAVSEDEAPFFNKFMHQIKENYSSFFKVIVKNQITLISNEESKISSIVTP